jgi:transketolase
MKFDSWRGFSEPHLSDDWYRKLSEMARIGRANILKMTTVAGSGHPGGSMSSIEMYLLLYNLAKVDPTNPGRDDRDRIIISHGHTSPGAYTALAAAGFFDITPALYGFRQAGSPFEGHVERSVPGVEWDTGNLGQGLSVGVGKALYGRLSAQNFHTWVLMGDGEQQKGQLVEARHTAVKFGLSRLTAFVDFNGLQISGKITDIMPQKIKAEWESSGWQVIEIDGHDLRQIYSTCRAAVLNTGAPIMILARTTMGKGVSFMENKEDYHGAALKMDQIGAALAELGGIENDVEALLARRKSGPPPPFRIEHTPYPEVSQGEPITLGAGDKSDNRSAFGKALVSVADANANRPGFVMAVFDCDLAKSVKTDGFAKKYPNGFFQCGISEHSTAATAGALSTERAISVWADFGVFGIDETYNQARLNDINHSNLKLFCTHSGVNVGEDGKTHQCIDYFSLLNSTFGWKVITPADPNQTDRIVRYVLATPGNFAVVMGRAVVAMVLDESGKPYFGEQYRYRYGRMETIRKGEYLALVCAGNMLPYALPAWNKLNQDGKRITLVSVSDWSDLHADDLNMLAQHDQVVTLEDHNVRSGLGVTIAAAMFERGLKAKLTRMGVSGYAPSGTTDDLYRLLGIDADGVAWKVGEILQEARVLR